MKDKILEYIKKNKFALILTLIYGVFIIIFSFFGAVFFFIFKKTEKNYFLLFSKAFKPGSLQPDKNSSIAPPKAILRYGTFCYTLDIIFFIQQ